MADMFQMKKERALGWTILVVDDEPDTRALLRLTLELSGYQVLEAVDGIDMLEKVEEQLPDLILLDVMMPRMDGIEACKRMRRNPKTADLPIVILSAKTSVEAIREGLDAGATRYLTKPIARDNLLETIREVLDPLFTV